MLATAIVRYGYALVFVSAAFEGDATLLTATFLAHRGYMRLGLVMLVAATSTVVINQVYYWLGRRYGQRWLAASSHRQALTRVSGWITRYGMPLVVASRFIFGFRVAIPIGCGTTGIPALKFVIGDIAGSIVWAVVLGTLGYAIGHFLESILDDLRRHEWWIAMVLFTGMCVLAAYRRDWSRARILKTTATQDGT